MQGKKSKQSTRESPDINRHYLTGLDTSSFVAGIPGPGRWLVFTYLPTAVFSLKISMATSSVGKTLVVPTPYAVKMAFVDAAFRLGWTDTDCGMLVQSLVGVAFRVAPPCSAIITHTFVKVRQEPHDTKENP